MQHQRPDQGEGGRILRQKSGKTLVDETPIAPREIQQFDGAFDQAVVAGHDPGGEQLESGVAVVHELLVERAIHVGFMGAHLDAADRQADDAGQFRVAAVEGGFIFVGVAGFVQERAVDGQRLGPVLMDSRHQRPARHQRVENF